jgi:hypothetical protein
MDRKISFHGKSCLFSPHEMFKNSGSGVPDFDMEFSVHHRALIINRESTAGRGGGGAGGRTRTSATWLE